MYPFSKRRGVSPVVATILLIALTVTAVGSVYLIFTTFNSQAPKFILTGEEFQDYNGDGLVDFIQLKAFSLADDAHNLSYVSIADWNVTVAVEIGGGGQALISVYTSKLSAQLETSTDILIGLSDVPDQFSYSTITVGGAVAQDPLIVTVTAAGNPVVGTFVSFTYEDDTPVSYPPKGTNLDGQIEAYLLPGTYIAKTSGGLQSEVFSNFLTKSVLISESNVETFYVKVLNTDGTPMSGVTVYAADTNQNDLGGSAVTNSSGFVTFTMSSGTYLFRINYISQDYWSSGVSIPGAHNNIYTIQLKSGSLAGTINYGGIEPGSGQRLYLYTFLNISLNQNQYTDVNSAFNFTSGVTSGLYRLRLYNLGKYIWSDIISTSTANLTVNFGGGDLNIAVMTGSTPIGNNIVIRLFHADGTYSGRYDRTNASGVAEFGIYPGHNFKIRADTLGQYIYSSTFYHTSDLVSVDLGGGSLNVLVTAGGVAIPSNVVIRLFTSSGTYTGRYDRTNTTGWAEFGSILGSEYKVRVDWLGQYQYSDSFNHTDESPQYVDMIGGRLDVLVTAGNVPLPSNVVIRLFTESGTYTGRYDRTNSSGYAEFGSIIGTTYKLRIDWLGQYTYTSSFLHNDSSAKTVNVAGGSLNVLVTGGGDPIPSNVVIRLFTDAGVYTGRYDRTNTTGWAEFGVILANDYKLRVDWLGQYTYTTPFTHDGTPQTVDIGGGSLNVLVEAGGTPIPSNVVIRLFTTAGVYTGRYDRTNSTGWAEFGVILSADYKVRVDWLSQYTYSGDFTHDGSAQTVDIGGGILTIKMTSGGEALPTNIVIRLFTASGTYTGRYDRTNATGHAEFGAIIGGDYKLRIDWLGKYTYTTTFTHSDSAVKVVDDVNGGTMLIHVRIGDGNLPNNVVVRLFTNTSVYTGRYVRSNGTGFANFSVIISGDYQLRLDYLSQYYYTNIFTHNGSNSYNVTYSGVGSMSVNVDDVNDVDVGDNQTMRLYHYNGGSFIYTGFYADVSSGIVTFNAVPDGDYVLYWYESGRYVYSGQFTALDGAITKFQVAN